MRQFANFTELLSEARRDLREMGVLTKTKSFQNKNITDNPDFFTYEIEDYVYMVTNPHLDDIPVDNITWCMQEFGERIGGIPLNPGTAWGLRESLWKQFMTEEGTFDYTYSDRMAGHLHTVVSALILDPMTRRAYLPIWDREIDRPDHFNVRVPCSLGYHFKFRQDKLNMTYYLRSSDFAEHFKYDIWLAFALQKYVASKTSLPVGHFVHHIGSFHVFAKDVAGVF